MQTNREDVGKRYLEIEIPVPPTSARATEVSEAFRNYYQSIAEARVHLQSYLAASGTHHFFFSGAQALDPEQEEVAISEGNEVAISI